MVSGGGQVGLKGWGWRAVEERSAGDSSKGRKEEEEMRGNHATMLKYFAI